MIVVDSSALAAILFGEKDAKQFAEVIAQSDVVIGAPTRFEFLMVAAGRLGDEGLAEAKEMLAVGRLETVEWGAALADLAVDAFVRFGKGNHRAKLNFGDCMAYALAKSLGAPLLFKGDDFALTDIESAL